MLFRSLIDIARTGADEMDEYQARLATRLSTSCVTGDTPSRTVRTRTANGVGGVVLKRVHIRNLNRARCEREVPSKIGTSTKLDHHSSCGKGLTEKY